jgi:hypothetical protein
LLSYVFTVAANILKKIHHIPDRLSEIILSSLLLNSKLMASRYGEDLTPLFAANPLLLYRYRFSQIAWLIDIRPFQHRNVIGKQLHGNGEDHRGDVAAARRDGHHVHPLA